jgi:hypothetical protein
MVLQFPVRSRSAAVDPGAAPSHPDPIRNLVAALRRVGPSGDDAALLAALHSAGFASERQALIAALECVLDEAPVHPHESYFPY